MDLTQVIQLVTQSGLPAGLIVWGQWFATARFWPWWSGKRAEQSHELNMLQARATLALGEGLQAQAGAITRLADVLATTKIQTSPLKGGPD